MSLFLYMCKKIRLDKIKAMLIVAKAQSHTNARHKRREIRIYWCVKCKAWHTTSQPKKLK